MQKLNNEHNENNVLIVTVRVKGRTSNILMLVSINFHNNEINAVRISCKTALFSSRNTQAMTLV